MPPAFAVQHLDELVREFLLFRGFTVTYKAFDAEIRAEKEKGFRMDKFLELMSSYISAYDLASLRDLWHHLNTKIFSRLEHSQSTTTVTKLETSVLRLYLVNCIQTKRPEKAREFFEKLGGELQSSSDWKEWFALPFIPNPETNPAFAGYFSRQWQDTLMLTLFNFLSLVFACLPPPRLADYRDDIQRQI